MHLKHYLQMEMKLSSDDEVHYFKKQAIQKIKEFPFFYDGDVKQQYVSIVTSICFCITIDCEGDS